MTLNIPQEKVLHTSNKYQFPTNSNLIFMIHRKILMKDSFFFSCSREKCLGLSFPKIFLILSPLENPKLFLTKEKGNHDKRRIMA